MSQPTNAGNAARGKSALECRACLAKVSPKTSKDIFKPWAEQGLTDSTTIAAEMAKVANIEIPDLQGYPRYICQKCLIRLKSAIPFVKDVRTSEEKLRNRLHQVEVEDSEKVWPKPIQLDKNLNGEIIRNSMDVEIKQEVISDDEFGDTEMDYEPEPDNMSDLDIKLEPEDDEQPAIQVTVNDSEAKEVVIDLEDKDLDELTPYKRDQLLTSLKEGGALNIKQSKPGNFMTNINSPKEFRVSLSRMDVDSQDIIDMNGARLDQDKLILANDKTNTLSTKSYKRRKIRDKIIKKLGPRCSCKNNCGSKLSKEQCQNICNYYCNASLANQRAFVINFTSKENKRKTTLDAKINRNFTFMYYLPTTDDFNNAQTVRVCKNMFINTTASNLRIENIWRSYEIWKTVDGRGKHKQKRDSEIVKSVCDHFIHLQNDKLHQLKQKYTGFRKFPIKRLTFNKMYNLYRSWVQSTNYSKIARSYQSYKSIILNYIPRDHIQTLQQENQSKKERKAKKQIKTLSDKDIVNNLEDVSVLYVQNENIKPQELKNEILDINDIESGERMIEIDAMKDDNSTDNLISPIDPSNKQLSSWIESDEIDYDKDDENYSDSEVSNFSDEFKEEINEEQKIKDEKRKSDKKKQINKKYLEDIESDTTSESANEDFDIEYIKKEIKQNKMSTRNNTGSDDNICETLSNNTTNEESLLTAKRKIPTRDPSIIRHYCKYHGLEYETISGRTIPKKVLGPTCPSICRKQCATKISQDQRQFIFNHFWSLGNKKKQMMFICNFTTRVYTNTLHVDAKNRDYSNRYFLPTTTSFDTKAEKIRVCSKMFFNTLACSHLLPKTAWTEQDKKRKQENSIKQEEINSHITKKQNESESPVKQTSNKQEDKEQDNTIIDFVYRAMPFEEFMAYFGREKYENSQDEPTRKKNIQNHINKVKRNLGKRYLNKSGKIVSERMMGPVCNCAKKDRCQNITENQRKFLFNYYWALGTVLKQRAFLVRFSTREYPKSRRRTSEKIRENQYQYYLPVTEDFDGEKARVCLVMFRNTLGVTQRLLRSAWKNYEQGQFKDGRGRYKRIKKIKKTITFSEKHVSARDHFELLRREDPELKAYKMYNKKYPNGAYLTAKMFRHYNEWFDPTVYSKKIQTFRQYEYVFRKLKKL